MTQDEMLARIIELERRNAELENARPSLFSWLQTIITTPVLLAGLTIMGGCTYFQGKETKETVDKKGEVIDQVKASADSNGKVLQKVDTAVDNARWEIDETRGEVDGVRKEVEKAKGKPK